MNTTQIVLAVIAIVAGPLGGWISAKLLRHKYEAEIAKLKAEVEGKLSDVRSNELENVRKANDILMKQIVEPLQKDIKRIGNELNRFRRAVEKIPSCPSSAGCPVLLELQSVAKVADDGDAGKQ